jgi:TonB-dependent SusC/RagA subfamily outer membrane receptor
MTRKASFAGLFQWLMLLIGFTLFSSSMVVAQNNAAQKANSSQQDRVVVKGNVSDANGPLVGVNVVEKGKSKGTITDASGNFSLTVSGESAIVTISHVGYNSMEMAVKGNPFMNVVLQPGNGTTLSGVVVTALGITRNKRSLGYDVGQISGDDMNKVAQTNALNSMAGKVSGVVVSQTGANPTSSVSVVIRGIRSLNGDNQPLFVIDGVPLQNSMNNIGVNNGNGNDVDYGNVISDINPNDIESISVLKGPSAAALYGSRAGNGVVLITTKSGRKSKALGISFNSTDEIAAPYHYFENNQAFSMGINPYTVATGANSWNGTIVDVPPGWANYYFGTPLNKGIQAIQWNSPLQADGSY